MDPYRFICGGASHEVRLSTTDSRVLSAVRRYVYPAWRVGIFASVRADERVQLARDVALDDAHALLSRLEADKALLPFDYTIQLEPAGTSRARAVRSVNVTVGGRGATATSGMAVATIDVMSLAWIDSEVAATLVAGRRMRPDEAESFRKWPGEVSVVEPLHDLRDMHPFVSDEGHTLQATRQSRATELPAVVASIVSFIEANECDQVEVAYLGDAPWG